MKPIKISDIVNAVSGELAWGEDSKEITKVVIDSREAEAGSLFVPIIGERVDAHRFIPDVLNQGATLVFSSDRTITGNQGACIYVEDTLKALQDFATWYRSLFTLPVIGITGSVGKTTTKEMISTVLEQKYKTLKTIGNLNSQIGVSLMMFHLEEDTEIAVFEMGISMPEEMDRLVKIAKPTTAVMTNIGVSHIGNLGTRENICAEKGKIITEFSEDGILYVCGNGDLKEMSQNVLPLEKCKGNCEILYYGTENDCPYYGDNIKVQEEQQVFTFHTPTKEEEVALSVMGTHNVNNAIVALTLGIRFGVPMDVAKKALLAYKPIAMRGVIKEVDGVHIIDDTYNASPDSINSNLNALFDYPDTGKKIAVLADVLELGERSEELHRGVGEFIVKEAEKGRKLSLLITVGKEAKHISDYVEANSDIPVIFCQDNIEVANEVETRMSAGDWILVKGSRGMHMDEVVNYLIKE